MAGYKKCKRHLVLRLILFIQPSTVEGNMKLNV